MVDPEPRPALTGTELSKMSPKLPTPGQPNGPKKKWYESPEGWKLAIEGLTLIAVVVYAVVTYYQWRDLRCNFAAEQRAWVMPFKYGEAVDDSGYVVGARVFYRNTGKTPALRAFAVANWVPRKEMIPTRDTQPVSGVASLSLPPDGETDKTIPIPADTVRLIMAGNSCGYIFGTVWYDDIFGHSHWVEFCAKVGPRFESFLSVPGSPHEEASDAQ